MDENTTRQTLVATDQSQTDPNCPDCGDTRLSSHDAAGELVCEGCGLVRVESRVDDAPEWRAFTQKEREAKARTGGSITYTRHDRGVSTEIGKGGELSMVANKKRAQYSRIQQWHSRRTRSKDRNLGFAFSELKRIGSQLTLPDAVREEVARLYEKAVEENLVKGRSMEGVLTALVYAVARKQGTPRTLEELADATGIEAREIGRTYRYIARELGLDIKPAEPEDYLPRFADMLNLSGAVQARARTLINEAREANLLAGKGRTGLAAAALYTAAVLKEEHRTQQQVADAAGVTVVTLRNRYQELVAELGFEDEVG